MRKKNFKGRCEKRVLGKCSEVCRTYDAIQYAYADLLQASDEVIEISVHRDRYLAEKPGEMDLEKWHKIEAIRNSLIETIGTCNLDDYQL